MKSAQNHIPPTDARANAPGRPRTKTPEEVTSFAETKSLLGGGLAGRQKRLEAGDMVSTDDAAELTGTSRVTVNAWISKGRAIGLTQTKRGYRMPAWQFDDPIWTVLPAVSQALGTKEGWALLAFLETALGALDGATPRAAIERGLAERVVDLARGS